MNTALLRLTRLRTGIIVATVYLAVVTPVYAQTPPGALRLILHCGYSPELTLRFTLENVGDVSTAAVFGVVLGNDRTYSPNDLALTVRRGGVEQTYKLADRSIGIVAGRLDPWVVALPARAAYSVSLPAGRFGAAEHLRDPADIQLQVTTRALESTFLSPGLADLKFLRLSVGTLTSNRLRFPAECSKWN